MTIFYISGHLDLTETEFQENYVPKLEAALKTESPEFVVGDARGADTLAQAWLQARKAHVTVFHMLSAPRNNHGFPLVGGFLTDLSRDEAMTNASTDDIAWARSRRSNTWKNLERRKEAVIERDRSARRAHPRFHVSESEAYPVYGLRETKETDESAVPIPQELLERHRKAAAEYYQAQSEIAAWLRKQELDPV